jgi:hypothetical protein
LKLFEIAQKEAHWVKPSEASLKKEYEVEYALPRRRWDQRSETIGAKYPIFSDAADFAEKILAAKVIDFPKSDFGSVHNLTAINTIDRVKELVATYSYPRDVDGIVAGFKAGKSMEMPIIIRGKRGRWILSGNTRMNVARIMNIPIKVIEVDAS